MIVVDSSVWIAAFRRQMLPCVEVFRRLPMEQILVGDLIAVELLQGARNEANAIRIERDLRRFETATMLDMELAVKAAANFRLLRSRGISIRKTMDLLIATFCIENNHQILHQDRDFSHFEKHLGLRVLQVA